ncbi:nuclear protein 1 [Chrysemys picta bellii]|uniref:nuclear protein 1 n=1 Tax=Chrysemys picta bellii TaxID=8478 RepID=UPI0032B16003
MGRGGTGWAGGCGVGGGGDDDVRVVLLAGPSPRAGGPGGDAILGAVAIKGGARHREETSRTDGRTDRRLLRQPQTSLCSHGRALLEPHKLVPTPFEGQHFDPYDYYSLTERYSRDCRVGAAGRAVSKREAAGNTNRPNPAGHERKIALKLQRSERRRGQE